MIYKVSNVTPKTSQKGTNYVQVTLQDEQGVIYDKINLFRGEATGKTEIEGNLAKNESGYWNFESTVVHTANIPPKGQNSAMAVQKVIKENVDHSQDRKEAGIANSGSISNATSLVTSMINAGIIPSVATENQIQEEVIKWARWYKAMYNNPSNLDQPPF